MSVSLFRLPNGLTICLSTLLCASVVLLQNAGHYANKLEQVVYSVSIDAMLAQMPGLLRSAGEVSMADELNQAEVSGLDRLMKLLPTDASVEEAPAAEPEAVAVVEETPAAEPEAIAVVEETPAAEPEAVAVVEETPAAEPEAVAVVEETPAAEPEAVAVVEETPAAEPEAVAVVEETPAAEPEAVAVVEETPAAEPVGIAKDADHEQHKEEKSPEPVPFVAAAPIEVEKDEQEKMPEQVQETPPMRCRIMMVGDSLMEDMGPLTHRTMKNRKGLEFVISCKYSTGLCRPDYFNWPAHMREQVVKRPPDLVIFFIGANDGMPIKEGRKLIATGGREWKEAYMRKIDEMVGIARGAGADVIWVEMPAVGGYYNKLLHDNQQAQREYCETHGITTLRTDPLLSGEWGKFEAYGTYQGRTVRLRSKDVTHLTTAGNKKVLDHLMPIIERRLTAFYHAHPERHLTPEQAARIKKVPVVYTCKYTAPEKKNESQPNAADAQPVERAIPVR